MCWQSSQIERDNKKRRADIVVLEQHQKIDFKYMKNVFKKLIEQESRHTKFNIFNDL